MGFREGPGEGDSIALALVEGGVYIEVVGVVEQPILEALERLGILEQLALELAGDRGDVGHTLGAIVADEG